MLNPSSQPGNNGHQNDYVFSKASPHPPNPLNYFGQQVLEALPLDVIVFEYIAPQNFRIVAGKHNNKLSHIIPSENAIGKTIREMHDPEHAEYIEKIMLSCIQTGETLRTENSFEIAGQSYWMAATYSAVRNENAEFTHILMAWEDFTERKLKELEAQKQQLEIIEHQAYQLAELSTPLLSISDTTMVMPLIGAIDSHRVQQILDTLLQGTAQTHATTIILDITGVPVVDTQVANNLIQASQAVRLLGAEVLITGIRPEVAQTIIGLGINLIGITTRGTLRDGIAYALAKNSSDAQTLKRAA